MSTSRFRPRGLPIGAVAPRSLVCRLPRWLRLLSSRRRTSCSWSSSIAGWFLFGTPVLPRAIGPLVVSAHLFLVGGLLSQRCRRSTGRPSRSTIAVTGFLALSSCFFAAALGDERAPALTSSFPAWIAAALATTALGILGYFGLTGELFTKFGRAAGGFQDPNVFGPFLVFPFVMLVRRALTRPLGSRRLERDARADPSSSASSSPSRGLPGAWRVLCVAICTALLFLTEQRSAERARLLGAGGARRCRSRGGCSPPSLSLPAITDSLFAERAQVVQDYDGGHLGRFQRHAIGFNMMLDHPLGIGALEFGNDLRRGRARHLAEVADDLWLARLRRPISRWSIWTLAAAFPLLFRDEPAAADRAGRLHRLPWAHPHRNGDRHRPLAARLPAARNAVGCHRGRSPESAAQNGHDRLLAAFCCAAMMQRSL